MHWRGLYSPPSGDATAYLANAESYLEASAASLPGETTCVTLMVTRNLTDQSRSQTDPSVTHPTHSGRSVKRLEDALPLFRRDPRAAIFDKESGTACACRDHGRLDGRFRCIARGVLQKVADQAPQKARVTLDAYRLPGHRGSGSGSCSRSFLGEEREQIHRLCGLQRVDGVKATGQKELSNQVIELSDVLGHTGADLGSLIGSGELHGNAEASERRAKLVGGACQYGTLRMHETFNFFCGAVEAAGEARHFTSVSRWMGL